MTRLWAAQLHFKLSQNDSVSRFARIRDADQHAQYGRLRHARAKTLSIEDVYDCRPGRRSLDRFVRPKGRLRTRSMLVTPLITSKVT